MKQEEAQFLMSDPVFKEIAKARQQYGYWYFANFKKYPHGDGPASFMIGDFASISFSGIYDKSINDVAAIVGNYGQQNLV